MRALAWPAAAFLLVIASRDATACGHVMAEAQASRAIELRIAAGEIPGPFLSAKPIRRDWNPSRGIVAPWTRLTVPRESRIEP